MKIFVAILLVLLLIFHQDYWQWDKNYLIWGFLPYQLAYHAVISIIASVVWYLATIYCWPADIAAKEDVL